MRAIPLFFSGVPKGRVLCDFHRKTRLFTRPLKNSLCAIALLSSVASAAVVHKIDDTTVTGDLRWVYDGKIAVAPNSSTTKPTPIAFEDISQITIKEPPVVAPPPPTPPVTANIQPDDGPNLGGSLLGALFGGNHANATREDAAPASTPAAAASTTHPTTMSTTRPTTTPATSPVKAVAKVPAIDPNAPPAISKNSVFKLTDGDQFHAALSKWADQKLSLKLASGPEVNLPSTAVSELWVGTAEQQTKAKRLTLEPGPEDIAFVTKDSDVILVKGLVLGMTGSELQFRFGDQDRKINLSKLVGLMLRSNSAAKLTTFHQLIHTDNGDQFSGIWSAVNGDSLTLQFASGPELKLPLGSITTIDFVNGRLTSLTDLTPAKVEQTPYLGRVVPYRVNKSLSGGPLVLSDGTYPRGLAVHSRCVLQYDVSAGFDRFKTKLGFEQPGGQTGRVAARVLGDGKPLYENPDARGSAPPVEIDVPLAGVHTLTLEIDFGKDQDVGDRVIWANPRLVRGK